MTYTGGKRTVEYRIWQGAKTRCYNPRSKVYVHYGERGITMSEEWRNDFTVFLRDMGPRPSPSHSLGRIDNDGPYSKENCRWETSMEQAKNSRNCRFHNLGGARVTTTDAARSVGLESDVVRQRLDRGWSIEQAVAVPKAEQRHVLTCDGQPMSVSEWAKVLGIPRATLFARIRYGWTDERIIKTPVMWYRDRKAQSETFDG